MIVVGLREHFCSCRICHRLSYVHGHNVHDTPDHQYLGHTHHMITTRVRSGNMNFVVSLQVRFCRLEAGANVLGCVLPQT